MKFKRKKIHGRSNGQAIGGHGLWPIGAMLVTIFLCLALLGGCGQKGDLVLPDPPPTEQGG